MQQTDRIRRRYDRIAPVYDVVDAAMEYRLFHRQRAALLQQASGRVLEVGLGTGPNLPFYGEAVELVGIDFSRRMLERARRRASRLCRSPTLLQMDVQSLEFPDDSFDCVVSTCVFCSVPDPLAGLGEIRRVCKRDGQILMLEHVRSERPVIGRLMDWLNFVPLHLYGANINRRTLDYLQLAGFTDVEVENVSLDILKRIRIHNDKRTADRGAAVGLCGEAGS